MVVVDVDSHVYEPPMIWEDYVAREERPAVRAAFWHEVDAGGLETTILNGRPVRALERSGIPRRACWRPGMTIDSIGALEPDVRHPVCPGAADAGERLRDMDAMGIDRAFLFPTLFAEHFPLVENPDAARVLARAYNDWLLDFASADPRRLLPVAILPLQSASFAVAEAERVERRGCKAAFIRPSFLQGRFPSHPPYQPVWKALEQLAAWGSRYPNHDTGTVEEARDMLGRCGVGEETVVAFLGGNAIRHFGLG